MRVKRWAVKSFEDATAIIQYLDFFLGLRILEWPRGQLRPYLSIFYGICLALFFIGNGITLSNIQIFRPNVFKFENCLYKGMFFISTISLHVFCIIGMRNTGRFLRYKKRIVKIEEQLQELGGCIDNVALFWRSLIWMSLWFIFLTFIVLNYSKWFIKHNNLSVAVNISLSYSYGETASTIVIIEFITSVHWLKLGYEEINSLLCKGFRETQIPQTKPVVNVDEGGKLSSMDRSFNHDIEGWRTAFVRLENLQTIKVIPKIYNERLWLGRIRQIHLELCQGAQLVFDIYGVQIGTAVALILLFLTSKLYYLYVELICWNRVSTSSIKLTILSIADCMVLGIKLCLICATCEYANRQIKKTNEILYNLPRGCNDREFTEEVQQFALQINQNEQRFMVHGFSRLSFNFIRVSLSSVTTYLVIMIQMSTTLESSSDNALRNNTFTLS